MWCVPRCRFYTLLSGKSFPGDKNKAEAILQDFSLFCCFACIVNQQVQNQVILFLEGHITPIVG